MAKPVQLRRRAAADIDGPADRYLRDAGESVASRFVDALQQALHRLSRYPLWGSLHYAYELDIPELRAWPVRRFPSVIFYAASNDRIEVWRVLHAHGDIPAWLATAEADADGG